MQVEAGTGRLKGKQAKMHAGLKRPAGRKQAKTGTQAEMPDVNGNAGRKSRQREAGTLKSGQAESKQSCTQVDRSRQAERSRQ